MGLESLSRAKAWGMEDYYRPPRDQKALPNTLHEDGDATEATVHRQA